MVAVTDEQMQARLEEVRAFTTVFLKKGAAYVPPELRPEAQARIVLEHGRRNMSLSAEGKLAIVGPIAGGGDIVGLCIFCVPEDEVRAIMEGDAARPGRDLHLRDRDALRLPGRWATESLTAGHRPTGTRFHRRA